MTESASPLTDPVGADGWPDVLNPQAGSDTSAFDDDAVKTHDWPADLNAQNDRQPGLVPGNDWVERPKGGPPAEPEA